MTTPRVTVPKHDHSAPDLSGKADLNHQHPEAVHYHSDLSDAISRNTDYITSVRGELIFHADHVDAKELIRALIKAFEVGNALNSAQVRALHYAKVLIGDASGTGCSHEERVRDKDDHLICQLCHMDVTGKYDN